jgi:hypothetical protein
MKIQIVLYGVMTLCNDVLGYERSRRTIFKLRTEAARSLRTSVPCSTNAIPRRNCKSRYEVLTLEAGNPLVAQQEHKKGGECDARTSSR